MSKKTVSLPLTGDNATKFEVVEKEFKRLSPWATPDGPSVLRLALHIATQAINAQAAPEEEPQVVSGASDG